MKFVGGPMDGRDAPEGVLTNRIDVPGMEIHPDFMDVDPSDMLLWPPGEISMPNGEPTVRYPQHTYQRDGEVWRYVGSS